MAGTHGLTHLCAAIFISLLLPGCCIAQNSAQIAHDSTGASINTIWRSWPKARPEDVQSAQSVIKTYFEIISGNANAERDWDRFRSLFLPDGHIVSVKTWNSDPHQIPDVEEVQKMVERYSTNLRKADYEEHPLDIQLKEFSDFVQASVTSEIRIHAANGVRSSRFVYSFELLKDGDRYWIVEVSNEMVPDSYRSQ